MGSWRDMRPASWARTVTRLRNMAEILRDHDFEVREPDNLDTPPFRRNGSSAIVEVTEHDTPNGGGK